MQTLYAAALTMVGDPEQTRALSEQTLARWAQERLGLTHLEPARARYVARATDGRRIELVGDAGRLVRWDFVNDPDEQPGWTYGVTAWLLDEKEAGATDGKPTGSTLLCRLGVRGRDGRLVEHDQPAGAPAFVRTLLDTGVVHHDGQVLGKAQVVGSTEVQELVRLLTDPGRRLPVVVLTPAADTNRPPLDPDRLARRLGGLAHVVVLVARSTTFALTEQLGGNALSVFGGAIRLYWPGFGPDDLPSRHPLWFLNQVRRLPQGGFGDQLFGRLGRVSALSFVSPRLEVRLRLEQTRRRQATARERLNALTEQLEASGMHQTAETHVIDEEWLQEHEKVVEELERTAQERDDALESLEQSEAEREALRDQLATHLDNIRQLTANSVTSSRGEASSSIDLEVTPPPPTVAEAVSKAEEVCSHLVFLPEAHSSAAASGFDRPGQVLEDLRGLDRVAQAWQAGELVAGFEEALTARGISGYRSGLSFTASTKYATDYERLYLDERVMLGPHLAHGTGAVTKIMRIYWYADMTTRVLVIGHVGRKLRDSSNP